MKFVERRYEDSPLGWLASNVEKIIEAGLDTFGLLWQGNCMAFSERESATYWMDMQEILRRLSEGTVRREWRARI